jgi:hypothetical protein
VVCLPASRISLRFCPRIGGGFFIYESMQFNSGKIVRESPLATPCYVRSVTNHRYHFTVWRVSSCQ